MWSRAASILVPLGILAALLTADAQPPRHLPIIGVLSHADLSPALADPKRSVSALRQGLHARGYSEGHTMVMEYRPHGETPAPLATDAAELGQRQGDVLVTCGLIPTRAAREATATLPIVFAGPCDPVERGLGERLAQPGGNRTGTAGTTVGRIGQQVALRKEVAPGAPRVAVLVDPTPPAHALRIPEFQAMPRSLGLALHLGAVRDPPTARAFATLAHERMDAIHIAAGPTFPPYRAQMVALVAKRQRPALYPRQADVRAGSCPRRRTVRPWPTAPGTWSARSCKGPRQRSCLGSCPGRITWPSTSRLPRRSGSRSPRLAYSWRTR